MTSYDEHAYPTAIFPQTTPNRMAVVATLHGLTPPPIGTARVLEIAGGDGMNSLALAAAFPGMEVVNFDLAGSVIARGNDWARRAGLTNVRNLEMDILDAAAGAIEGPFDYVIAHGIYAWVPDHVREAVMALIGRVLSPHGVAFLSYNAKPGGWLRLAIRDMLMHELQGIEKPEARLVHARAFLSEYGQPRDRPEEEIVTVMRKLALEMVDRPDAVLIHDEMGEAYHPQTLMEVAEAAGRHGLQWLGDSDPAALMNGFLMPDDPEHDHALALRRQQSRDYEIGRYFRCSLLVRDTVQPSRHLDVRRLLAFQTATRARVVDEGYKVDDAEFELNDAALNAALRELIALWPGRRPLAGLLDDEDRLTTWARMFDQGLVHLYVSDAPHVREAGERPEASPLVRVQLEDGFTSVAALDHRTITLADPRARAFVQLLDGTRTRAELAAAWEASGQADGVPVEDALQRTAYGAVMKA